MEFIPAFEIGIWNLWIFMFAWMFLHMVPIDWLIFRYDIKAKFQKGGATPPYNKNEKIVSNLNMVIWFLLIIYSIFLPLPLGTPLLFSGIALFVIGFIIFEIANISWIKTEVDKPITTGIYRYSRHPVYIGVIVQFLGMGIASASGLFLLLAIVYIATSIYITPAEERYCIDKYGDSYKQYLNRTSRWIGMPKS